MHERTLRRWWVAATIGVAVFAAYVSLVPFDLVAPPPGVGITSFIWSQFEVRVFSPSNLLANCVMFIPFGFFGTAALADERSRLGRWIGAVLLLLPASLALSVVIEAAQAFVPRRTPSLPDIFGQTVGTGLGFLLWSVLASEVRHLTMRFAGGHRRAFEMVLALYASLQVLLMLQPMDFTVEVSSIARKYHAGQLVLNPLRSPTLTLALLPSILGDVLLAIPIGVAAAILGTPLGKRRTMPRALALGWLFFLAGEIAQVFVMSRTADVVDFAANAIGVAAGAVLVAAVTDRTTGVRRPVVTGSPVLAGALGLATLLYLAYNWSPFDFTFTRQMLDGRLGRLLAVPFASYLTNPEFKALSDIGMKMSLALPFGILFELLVRPERHRYARVISLTWLAASAAFFSAVEVGQVFLPSRYPDNTDVLLATAGVWAGLMLARPFARIVSPVRRIDVGLEVSGLPVIDATPPRPAPAAEARGARKPMMRPVPHREPSTTAPKGIRRMPPDGSADPGRGNSH